MDALVLSNKNGQDVTTSLIVAEIFGKNHQHVLRDIRELHCSEDFHKSNFGLLVEMKKLPQGGASKAEYYEITKDGFSFLVMGYTGEKAAEFKEKFINEFNKRDSLLKSDDYILARSKEILERRLNLLEQQMYQKDEQLQLQENVIIQQAPKVEYHDKVLQATNAIPTTVIAKELGMSAIKLNKILNKNKVIYKVGGTWVLHNQYNNKGYAVSRTYTYTDEEGNTKTSIQLYWTELGRKHIHEFVNKLKQKVA